MNPGSSCRECRSSGDASFRRLERANDAREHGLAMTATEPGSDSLRSEPSRATLPWKKCLA